MQNLKAPESNTNIDSIHTLFSNGNIIRIPPYQRAYSWDEKQFQQFYVDLIEQNGKNYYLGQLLFERSADTLYIIDGQQRLTTAIIFFIALAKAFKNLDIDNTYLINTYLTDVFRTISEDQTVLKRIIKKMNVTENFGSETLSQKKIIKAFSFFSNKLTDKPIEILKKLQVSLENATVLTYYIDNKIQATKIFEYQNNRGKDLSPFEIIKAYLMHQIYLQSHDFKKADNDIVDIQTTISSIYRNIEAVDGYFTEYELLNNLCYLYYGIEGNVESIKKYLSTKDSEEVGKVFWIKSFFDNFLELTQNAKDIIIKKQKDIRLSNLFLIGNEINWKIILLVLADKEEIHSNFSDNILKLLEILCFKLKLGDFRSDYLPSFAKNYFNSTNNYNIDVLYNDIRRSTVEGFKWYWNNDKRFELIIENYFGNETYHYHRHVIKYVLWQYENNLRSEFKSGVLLDRELYDTYTIEHIKPQKPDKGEYSESFVEKYLHKAGNLALLTQPQNSKFGNKPFKKKIELFQDTALLSYKEIRAKEKWRNVEIEERHNNIFSFVKNYFSVENL